MALASRVTSLERLPFRVLRTFNFSTSSPASASASANASQNPTSEASKKPKQRKKKNLIEVAQFLPNWGIGYHMAKTHWINVSYQITKINLYKDGRHGKAWGIAYKDGESREVKDCDWGFLENWMILRIVVLLGCRKYQHQHQHHYPNASEEELRRLPPRRGKGGSDVRSLIPGMQKV